MLDKVMLRVFFPLRDLYTSSNVICVVCVILCS